MTLKSLYQRATGDRTTHQRTIATLLNRQPKRRQQMIQARREGRTLRAIAEHHGVSHATVQSSILRTFEAIRKQAAGEPRYNHTGRRRRANPPTRRQIEAERTPLVQTHLLLKALKGKTKNAARTAAQKASKDRMA